MSGELKTEQKTSCVIVTLPPTVNASQIPNFERTLTELTHLTQPLHVLDFGNVAKFNVNVVKPFADYKALLEKSKRKLFSIHVKDAVHQIISREGVEKIFSPVDNLAEAFQGAGLKQDANPDARPKLDTKFVNPFIESTMKTFETQVGIKLVPGKPFLKAERDMGHFSLAGIINLTCKDFSGTISICFTSETFLKVYEVMLGEKLGQISPEAQDAAAELLNIIYGQAKTALNQEGYHLEKAIPTVLCGDKLQLHYRGNAPAIVLPFDSDMGPFFIELLISLD